MDSTINAAFHVVIEESANEFKNERMKKADTYLDEIGLTEKYKNKPDQLAALLRNSWRMWCSTREVDLIEDP